MVTFFQTYYDSIYREKSMSYYKFLDLDIFVEVDNDVSAFEIMLEKNLFKKVENIDIKSNYARVLKVEMAGPNATNQIFVATFTDKYGPESVIPSSKYNIYRFKNNAMMVYSYNALQWKLGILESVVKKDYVANSVINRFLSLALLPMGIVGFWGSVIGQDLIPMRQVDSAGEAFFIDVKEKKVFSRDESFQIPGKLKVLKWGMGNRGMEMEELFAFMLINCAFLDYPGSTFHPDRLLKGLMPTLYGEITKQEINRPRIDKSL